MKQDTSKIKYFIYARKSSESEERQVQSIDDQVARLKELADTLGLSIKKIYTEAKSAKQPNNRPVLAEMLTRIESGEASGILCWQINRLSRNPIDSAKIQWLLQEKTLKSIQTIDRQYLPEDNVLLFSVESGMANQFIIDLRKNTMRGMESKLEKGWSPNVAKLGYLNDQLNKIIIPDPVRLPLVRKMWDLMLTGNYSPAKILEIATNDWGFKTRGWKKRGDKPLSLSGIYRVFTSKFYAGIIEWNGREYAGKHETIITLDEFDRVQFLLGRKLGKPRPQKHPHAFSGLIFCGECGAMITAETKFKLIKTTGEVKRYDYYHCTGKKKYINCSQKQVILEQDLEKQIDSELTKYTILPEFKDWALEILNKNNDKEIESRSKIHETQIKTLLDTQKQLDGLTQMRYRDLINDEEYLNEKTKLQSQIAQLKNKLRETETRAESWLELTEKTFDFATYARIRFANGDLNIKKEILSALGSNCTLKDKILSIQPNEWLKPIAEGYPAIEKEYLRSELNKKPLNKAKTDRLRSVLTHWGARRESDPRDRCHRAAFYH